MEACCFEDLAIWEAFYTADSSKKRYKPCSWVGLVHKNA